MWIILSEWQGPRPQPQKTPQHHPFGLLPFAGAAHTLPGLLQLGDSIPPSRPSQYQLLLNLLQEAWAEIISIQSPAPSPSTLPRLALLQPHELPCSFLNMPSQHQPQGLCTSCSFCPKCPFLRHPHAQPFISFISLLKYLLPKFIL